MSTASELRELADDELRQKLAENKDELFNLRFQIVTGQLVDTRRIKVVKREIARILTVMREREIAAARAGVTVGDDAAAEE
jgi:large subunit ribosomal protein L29